MYDVSNLNLKCATCGKPITELPFPNPDPSRAIYCREDNRKRRRDF